MKMFKSDNVAGVHPKIMEAVVNANVGHENPYGNDTYSKKAAESISKLLGAEVKICNFF